MVHEPDPPEAPSPQYLTLARRECRPHPLPCNLTDFLPSTTGPRSGQGLKVGSGRQAAQLRQSALPEVVC